MVVPAEAFDLARSLRVDDRSRYLLLEEVASAYDVRREDVVDAVANPSSGRVFTYGFALTGGSRTLTHVAWVPDKFDQEPPAPGRATELRGKQASPLRERGAKKRDRPLVPTQAALVQLSANKRDKKKVTRVRFPRTSAAAPQKKRGRDFNARLEHAADDENYDAADLKGTNSRLESALAKAKREIARARADGEDACDVANKLRRELANLRTSIINDGATRDRLNAASTAATAHQNATYNRNVATRITEAHQSELEGLEMLLERAQSEESRLEGVLRTVRLE
jgi:hypothetical protein